MILALLVVIFETFNVMRAVVIGVDVVSSVGRPGDFRCAAGAGVVGSVFEGGDAVVEFEGFPGAAAGVDDAADALAFLGGDLS